MVGALVKLVSLLQNIQSIWTMFAGAIVENKELTGKTVYALSNAVEWFQSTYSAYSVMQPITDTSKPLGRIGSTYYKSNTLYGNGQIYTSVILDTDFIVGGKNYKGETIYIRSADAGVPEKSAKTNKKTNPLIWLGVGATALILLSGDSKK